MRVHIILLVALVMPARPALSGRLHAGDGAAARMFGVTATDVAAPGKAAGKPDYAKAPSGGPLRVKARFVRELADGGDAAARRGGEDSRGRLSFLVAVEGGEMRCEMDARAKGAEAVRGMKIATPVVIHGTLDPRRKVFRADAVVQGWGHGRMEGGS